MMIFYRRYNFHPKHFYGWRNSIHTKNPSMIIPTNSSIYTIPKFLVNSVYERTDGNTRPYPCRPSWKCGGELVWWLSIGVRRIQEWWLCNYSAWMEISCRTGRYHRCAVQSGCDVRLRKRCHTGPCLCLYVVQHCRIIRGQGSGQTERQSCQTDDPIPT